MKKKWTRDELQELLQRHNGNVRQAAAEAGVPFKSIYRRLHAEGLFDELEAIRGAADARAARRATKRAEIEMRQAKISLDEAAANGDSSALIRAAKKIIRLDLSAARRIYDALK